MKYFNGFLLIIFLMLLSGCSVVYNLDISDNFIKEDINFFSSTLEDNEQVVEAVYPIYYDSPTNNINKFKKLDDVVYYNSSLKKDKDGLNILNYNYNFNHDNYKKSRFLFNSFDNYLIKKYDHDEDGKDDYMMFSTTNSFGWFNIYDNLDEVTINIHCGFKIISTNADSRNKNTMTWHLTSYDLKPINFVYDPDVKVDDRSLFDKIISGKYFSIFTVSLLLFGVGYVIYIILKKKGERRDQI